MTITQTPATTKVSTDSMARSSSRAQITHGGHMPADAHYRDAAVGSDDQPGQGSIGDQTGLAGLVQTPPQAIGTPHPTATTPARDTLPDQIIDLTNPIPCPSGRGSDGRNGSPAIASPAPTAESLDDPFLAFAAAMLDDLEAVRIAQANRLGDLTRGGPDADGIVRGLGLDARDPDVARVAAIVDIINDAEHQATLNLQRIMRRHPLGPWIKAQKGVGDKQAARLLAVIGDPYINASTGQPRTVSALWAYCGHGDPARRRRKGMTQADLFALGSPDAKKRIWGIAASCLKAQGPYADVYYARKDATVGREHVTECVRCGPSGKPAQPGSPWSDAHRHADALRVVGKAFLRDLWIEARRLHEERS